MTTDRSYLDFVLGDLNQIGGITWKSMFGGFGLFHDVVMFALISEDTLYFKVAEYNQQDYVASKCPQFRSMPYFRVPDDVLEDKSTLIIWARKSINVAHAASVKQKKK